MAGCATASRLARILQTDRPWRRAAEVCTVVGLACTLFTACRQPSDGSNGQTSDRNIIPTAVPATTGPARRR